MSSDNFATLGTNSREMVHIPFVVGAIAVFHSVPGTAASTPIDLDACTLAKVLSYVYSKLVTFLNYSFASNISVRMPTSPVNNVCNNAQEEGIPKRVQSQQKTPEENHVDQHVLRLLEQERFGTCPR